MNPTKKRKKEGVLTLEELETEIKTGRIEYVTICLPHFTQTYYKRIEANIFLKDVMKDGMKFPEFVWQFSVVNDVLENKNYNLGNLVDNKVFIDVEAGFRILSWLGKNHAICFGEVMENDGKTPHNMYVRNILKSLLNQVEEKHGITFKHAPELEYYLFKTRIVDIERQFPKISLDEHNVSSKMSDYFVGITMDRQEDLNIQIKRNIKNCGITIEGLSCEYSPGQQEINIKYDDSLFNADNHILLKQCIKHTAYMNGFGASFMAKCYVDKNGSSAHVHISAWRDGRCIFSPSLDESENSFIEGPEDRKISCNKNLLYFIGGLCQYMHEMFLLFASNVNAYKRFKIDSFAPIHTNSWCYDSRTSGIRVVGEEDTLHVEVRFAGADANAYLLLVAIIGAGMDGIENKIEAPPMSKGNCYENKDRMLQMAPSTLLESVLRFEKSAFCKKLLGEKMFDYLITLGHFEWNQYNDHISTYEVKRYLDLV